MAILATAQPIYQPAMRVISAITNAKQASVTTTFDHLYISGTIVRIYVPSGYGMKQIDTLTGKITVTGNTTFTINIDTRNYDSYTTPALWPQSFNFAQVVPVGEDNNMLTAAVQNVLPN